MFSCSWEEIYFLPKYLLIVTLSSIFSRAICFHGILKGRVCSHYDYSFMIDDADSRYFQINGWSSLLINLEVKFTAFNWLFSPKHGKDHWQTYWALTWEGDILNPFWGHFHFIFPQNIYLLSPLFNSHFYRVIFCQEISKSKIRCKRKI